MSIPSNNSTILSSDIFDENNGGTEFDQVIDNEEYELIRDGVNNDINVSVMVKEEYIWNTEDDNVSNQWKRMHGNK